MTLRAMRSAESSWSLLLSAADHTPVVDNP